MIIDKENVTVIIATYNNANTVVKAIESVTTGVRPANQIIVGDNDSQDGTYEVLCELLQAESVTIDGKTGLPPQFDGKVNNVDVKIFRKRSTTIGDTVNTAMQMKWQGVTIFGFMEPTSWYAPDKISQSIRVFNSERSVACVVSDCDSHYIDGRVERIFRCSFDIQRLLANFSYDRNFLVRSEIFPKLKSGFSDKIPIRDDYDFLLRLSEVGLIYHIAAPLHNNIVKEIDEAKQQSIQQYENTAQHDAIQRRNPSDG